MAGRPLKFQSVEELDHKIEGYFNDTPKEEWTWTGLALYLDTSRQTLLNYEERPEFVDSIKKGLDRVENGYEIDLKKSGRTGTIFALKNFDWKDQNYNDITSGNKPLPIIPLNAILANNSNNQDNKPLQENKDSTGGYKCIQDNINPPILDSNGTIGQIKNTDLNSIGEFSTP